MNINDSCKTRRGCNTDIDTLAHDKHISIVFGGLHAIRDDIMEIQTIFDGIMDEVMEEEFDMEEVSA